MPYALIPEGFTLKKVTKAQEDAVKDHRRHEDVKTFLGNETTPVLIGGVAIATLTPILITLFLQLLEEQNVTVTDTQKEAIKRGIILGPAPAVVFKKLTELDLSDFTKGLKVFT